MPLIQIYNKHKINPQRFNELKDQDLTERVSGFPANCARFLNIISDRRAIMLIIFFCNACVNNSETLMKKLDY